jgi:hypothetical protein
MASFWSDPNLDPKRQYRFVVYINNFDPFIAKTVKKPSFTIGVSRHQYLNHEFKYPTTVKWNDVTMTFADPANPDVTKSFVGLLQQSGYSYPTDPNNRSTVSRDKSVVALGQVRIQQIDADGNPIEEWVLHNAFVSSVEFGQLSYASEDMVEINATLVYDWAQITSNVGGVPYIPLNQ